jgi:hypothetical protein
MTYGRGLDAENSRGAYGAGVSHLAELVRGDLPCRVKAPSSGLRPPSPQGEKGRRNASEETP